MHTLLVFLSLIGGAVVFGPVGLLLGPLTMTAFLTLAGIYRERYRPFLGRVASDPLSRNAESRTEVD
jgi:predicted PurR-regulated permease PerM